MRSMRGLLLLSLSLSPADSMGAIISGLFALVALLLGTTCIAVGDSPGSESDSLKALLIKDLEWYNSEEARLVAASVVSYQSKVGAWPKNHDLLQNVTEARIANTEKDTIDNDATTLPMSFLARMVTATGDAQYKDSFIQGLDYLLAAQYANGGWPQYYPLKGGYMKYITFNDRAMVNVLSLLQSAARGQVPYNFIDRDRLNKASNAVDLGVKCILTTQLQQNGTLAGWAAQYNERTLEPAGARAYEPPSLDGGETANIVEFLMMLPRPTREVVVAIEGAIAWLERVEIKGFEYRYSYVDRSGNKESSLVANPDAQCLWARFYELDTNRPIFAGRDGVIRYSMEEVEQERRGGFKYYGIWAQKLLTRHYPRWEFAQCKRKCYREEKCNLYPTLVDRRDCKSVCKIDCRRAVD